MLPASTAGSTNGATTPCLAAHALATPLGDAAAGPGRCTGLRVGCTARQKAMGRTNKLFGAGRESVVGSGGEVGEHGGRQEGMEMK